MRVIFWGKGARGAACLRALITHGYQIPLVITPHSSPQDHVALVAEEAGLSNLSPKDPNSEELRRQLHELSADLFVLGGYGGILKQRTIDIPKLMTINLHGGKLPQYRGSSPMNWALINGETSFGISIIKVDAGIDTGPVLASKEFPITETDTIVQLHEQANTHFPTMLIEVVEKIGNDTLVPLVQAEENAAYYPLRRPEDGFILFDQHTAVQIHNRVRALTHPYPCAFTYYRGRKLIILKTELTQLPYGGEAGRIYRITQSGLLVCAQDSCLWLRAIQWDSPPRDADFSEFLRYEKLATVKEASLNFFKATSPVS